MRSRNEDTSMDIFRCADMPKAVGKVEDQVHMIPTTHYFFVIDIFCRLDIGIHLEIIFYTDVSRAVDI